MTPTMKLRWVERKTWKILPGGPIDGHGNALVLQQWWETVLEPIPKLIGENHGEWRDIPTEAENE